MPAAQSASPKICFDYNTSCSITISGDAYAHTEGTWGLGTTEGGAEALAIALNGMTQNGTVTVSFDVNGSGGLENISIA